MDIDFYIYFLLFSSFCYLLSILKNKRLIIDHRFLLLIGFIYYWIIPVISYRYNLYMQNNHILYYSKINNESMSFYLLSISLIAFSFVCGDFFSRRYSDQNGTLFVEKSLLKIILIFFSF